MSNANKLTIRNREALRAETMLRRTNRYRFSGWTRLGRHLTKCSVRRFERMTEELVLAVPEAWFWTSIHLTIATAEVV